jgi:hypothetical protein
VQGGDGGQSKSPPVTKLSLEPRAIDFTPEDDQLSILPGDFSNTWASHEKVGGLFHKIVKRMRRDVTGPD